MINLVSLLVTSHFTHIPFILPSNYIKLDDKLPRERDQRGKKTIRLPISKIRFFFFLFLQKNPRQNKSQQLFHIKTLRKCAKHNSGVKFYPSKSPCAFICFCRKLWVNTSFQPVIGSVSSTMICTQNKAGAGNGPRKPNQCVPIKKPDRATPQPPPSLSGGVGLAPVYECGRNWGTVCTEIIKNCRAYWVSDWSHAGEMKLRLPRRDIIVHTPRTRTAFNPVTMCI